MECLSLDCHPDLGPPKKRSLLSWRPSFALKRASISIREALLVFAEAQKAKYAYTFSILPWRKVLIALIPFLGYLMVFKNYVFLRKSIGLDMALPESLTFLPWLERTIFHCFPHKILAQFANPVFDIIAAIPYLIHFVLPVAFPLYLFTKPRRRRDIFAYFWCLGWVNFITVVIQLFFATAPPWYTDSAVFDSHGTVIAVNSPPEAGFVRVDAMLPFPLFNSIYSKSPLKFGAFPSLHVAWPTVVLAIGPWFSPRVGALHVLWISWAAMYSQHHYGVDAMCGILLVSVVYFMSTKFWSPFKKSAVIEGKAHVVDSGAFPFANSSASPLTPGGFDHASSRMFRTKTIRSSDA